MQIALWISASISVVALRPARNQPLDQVSEYWPLRVPRPVSNPASAHVDVIVRLAAGGGRRTAWPP